MTQKDKEKLIKKLLKLEGNYYKAESDISSFSEIVQPFFEEEISVVMSTDGAVVTTIDGEKGFVIDILRKM